MNTGRAALATIVIALGFAAPASAAPVAAPIESGDPAAWTPSRMLAAAPIDLGLGLVPGFAAPKQNAAAVPLPGAYPYRTHGRIFASVRGSDFSCSGTMITSGKGNLVATAGRCVFEPGAGGGTIVDDLVFVPAYSQAARPFGVWPARYAAAPKQWVTKGKLDHDLALVQLGDEKGTQLQGLIGSRGLTLSQPDPKKLEAYGYPAEPDPPYDGESLVSCRGKAKPDPKKHGGDGSFGIRCDAGAGAEGGAFISQGSLLASVISHGHGKGGKARIYGPRLTGSATELYRFSDAKAFPSIEPIECSGRPATIIGTDMGEKLTGTRGRDVIATLGGNDTIKAKGGKDIICSGAGKDVVKAGGGKDRIDGGPDRDVCDGGPDPDRATGCERKKRIP